MKQTTIGFARGLVNQPGPLVPVGAGVVCKDIDIRDGTFKARPDILQFTSAQRFRPHPTAMTVVTLPTGERALVVVEPFSMSGKLYTRVLVYKGVAFEDEPAGAQPALPEPIVVMDNVSGYPIYGQAVEPVEFVTAGNYLYLVNFGHADWAPFATYRVDLNSLQGSFQDFGIPGSTAPAAAHACTYHGFFAAGNIRTSFDDIPHPLRVEISDAPTGNGVFNWNPGEYATQCARYYYDVPANSGDSITRQVELAGNLIAFTGRAVFAGAGVPGQSFGFERILSIGCLDPRTVKLVERPGEKGYIYFVASDGLPKRIDGTSHMVENVGALEDGRSPLELTMRKYVSGAFLSSSRGISWSGVPGFLQCPTRRGVACETNGARLLDGTDMLEEETAQPPPTGYTPWIPSWEGAWYLYQTFRGAENDVIRNGFVASRNTVSLWMSLLGSEGWLFRVQIRPAPAAAGDEPSSTVLWEGDTDLAPKPGGYLGWIDFYATPGYDGAKVIEHDGNLAVFVWGIKSPGQAILGYRYPGVYAPGSLILANPSTGEYTNYGDAVFAVKPRGFNGQSGGRYLHGEEYLWYGSGRIESNEISIEDNEQFGILSFGYDKPAGCTLSAFVWSELNGSWVDVSYSLPCVAVGSLLGVAQKKLRWAVTMETTVAYRTPKLLRVGLSVTAESGQLSHVPSAAVWAGRYCLMLRRNTDVAEDYDVPATLPANRNGSVALRDMLIYDGSGWTVWEAVGATMAAAMKDKAGRPRLLMVDGEVENYVPQDTVTTLDPDSGYVSLTTFGLRLARNLSWRPPWPRFITGSIPLGEDLGAGRIVEINALARNERAVSSAILYISATAEGNPTWESHNIPVACGLTYFGFKYRARLCVGRMATLLVGFGPKLQLPIDVALLSILAEAIGPRYNVYRQKPLPSNVGQTGSNE